MRAPRPQVLRHITVGKDPANDRAELRKAAGHTLEAEIVKYLTVKEQTLKHVPYLETKLLLERLEPFTALPSPHPPGERRRHARRHHQGKRRRYGR